MDAAPTRRGLRYVVVALGALVAPGPMLWLAGCTSQDEVAPGTATDPFPLPTGELIVLERGRGREAAVYAGHGLTVTAQQAIVRAPPGTATDARYVDRLAVTLVIRVSGYRAHVLAGPEAPADAMQRFGVLKHNVADYRYAVILASKDMRNGNCCEVVKMAMPTREGFVTVTMPMISGDGLRAMPSDISADGIVDYVRPDPAFSGRFGSAAEGAAPSQVWNIRNGLATNVSHETAFRGLYAREMGIFARGCEQNREGAAVNAACAAYVAAAARAGHGRTAWARMLAVYDRKTVAPDRPCTVPGVASGCDARKPMSFPPDLREFLIEAGYMSATPALAIDR